MTDRRRPRRPLPACGAGSSPVAAPATASRPTGPISRRPATPNYRPGRTDRPAGPAARRPGQADRLRAQSNRLTQANQQRLVEARRRRHIGFRVAILAVVLGLAFTVTFGPLGDHLNQQQELAAARAELAQAQVATDDLEAEVARWSDPAYVQAQARQRLDFVMPGDISYQVVDADKAPAIETTAPTQPTATVTHLASQTATETTVPWYVRLAESLAAESLAAPAVD